MERNKANVYEVKFRNGIPGLSECAYNSLLHKGLTEIQIQASFGIISRYMIKMGLQTVQGDHSDGGVKLAS